MKIQIRYKTNYHYQEKVGFSRHIFRLFPKPDHYLAIQRVVFKTNNDADIQYRKDLFDNDVAYCFYPEKYNDLKMDVELDLELREKNAFHFILEPHALDTPFCYKPEESRFLGAYLHPSMEKSLLKLPFWKAPSKPMPTVGALVELNDAIFKNIKYVSREEGAARAPAETLQLGEGACRDFAVLLMETLRTIGIAARLVSGYLCEFESREKRAEGSLHAWTEAYLPGGGWIGLDPTNGILCNHNHIAAAVGLVPDDISPIQGNYYNKSHVPSQMSSALQLIKCE